MLLLFFSFLPGFGPKPEGLLWNTAELLALSHKTNTPLFLFQANVFLSSVLWLSYTLPSLLIFLVFL